MLQLHEHLPTHILSRKEEEIEKSIATLEKCLTEEYVIEYQKQKVWSDLEAKKRELWYNFKR